MSGVDVYSPSGEMIARVLCPETVANAAFGGPDGDDLLLCSSTAAYLLKTKAVGAIYGGAATPLPATGSTTTTTKLILKHSPHHQHQNSHTDTNNSRTVIV